MMKKQNRTGPRIEQIRKQNGEQNAKRIREHAGNTGQNTKQNTKHDTKKLQRMQLHRDIQNMGAEKLCRQHVQK